MTRPVTADDHERITAALATEGGHLSIGHNGFTLHSRDCRLSGYLADELKEACIARGLPVIDNRPVSEAVMCRIVIAGPMIAVGRAADPPPWHALSYAPLGVVAAASRLAGADVRNIPESDLAEGLAKLGGSDALASIGELL